METRTTTELITFRGPFALLGLDGIQPPGSYTVQTEEERLDTMTFVAWRQTGCTLVLRRNGGMEYAAIDPQALREALIRDGDQGGDPPAAPSFAARSPATAANCAEEAVHDARRKSDPFSSQPDLRARLDRSADAMEGG